MPEGIQRITGARVVEVDRRLRKRRGSRAPLRSPRWLIPPLFLTGVIASTVNQSRARGAWLKLPLSTYDLGHEIDIPTSREMMKQWSGRCNVVA